MDVLPKDIEDQDRFNCFIVFEPSSLRVNDHDILFIGDGVYEFFKKIYEPVQYKQRNLNEEILYNRLSKFSQMLDLVEGSKQIIITRFFDRIWRRYGYISHLGEILTSMDSLVHYYPEYLKDPSIIAQRSLKSDLDGFDDDSAIDAEVEND
ncbi:MAG: hypothetical protein VW378_06655 [bacterium]